MHCVICKSVIRRVCEGQRCDACLGRTYCSEFCKKKDSEEHKWVCPGYDDMWLFFSGDRHSERVVCIDKKSFVTVPCLSVGRNAFHNPSAENIKLVLWLVDENMAALVNQKINYEGCKWARVKTDPPSNIEWSLDGTAVMFANPVISYFYDVPTELFRLAIPAISCAISHQFDRATSRVSMPCFIQQDASGVFYIASKTGNIGKIMCHSPLNRGRAVVFAVGVRDGVMTVDGSSVIIMDPKTNWHLSFHPIFNVILECA